MSQPGIVCANIGRSPSDPHACVMDSLGLLRQYLVGTRRFTAGINPERQRLFPVFGLINYLAARLIGGYRAESIRFAAVPIFERWAQGHLREGDHLFTGFGYLNRCLEWVKERGGLALLEARNSHPSNFWTVVAEEYARWDCKLPPVYPIHHMRQQRSVVLADYIFSPSTFVTESFVSCGFPKDRILPLNYPVDVSLFKPSPELRPRDKPLTIINTGQLSLRKGTPYLLEAFEMVRKEVPNARLLLTRDVAGNFESVIRKKGWDKLPTEWAGRLPHDQLAKRLRSADVFVMPSIEEGMVRTVAEAMGCDVPVVVTRNTGISDLVQEGVNGSVVPIRDSVSIAKAILKWWDRIQRGEFPGHDSPQHFESLSLERFTSTLVSHLQKIGLMQK